uniref:Uncharacterized protein n=1 Tax=Agrotis segetum granulosis virus TaxID=10464 RepID=A0A023MI67_GVAS|nr:hypothetical protein AsGV031 [Agrotis segetum granulovirus]
MEMPEAYILNTLYDDLYKFIWPVLIERGENNLWLDLVALKPYFKDICLKHNGKNKVEFVILNDDQNVFSSDYFFVPVKSINTCFSDDEIINTTFKTVLSQFLWCQLPPIIHKRLDDLKLVSIFDIADFWNKLKLLDHFQKYWLFRYKIVVMRYENEKCLREQNNDSETSVEDGVDDGPKNDFKTSLEMVCDINCETELKSKEEKIKELDLDSSYINTINKENVSLIDSLMSNIDKQFEGIKKNDTEYTKLHTRNAFLTLLIGTTALLEQFLHWC